MFEGHPKGLWALALANTGERFGYYTMLAVFLFFLQDNFGLELISSNFSWFHTQEGYWFWSNINIKWTNELRKLLFEDKKIK